MTEEPNDTSEKAEEQASEEQASEEQASEEQASTDELGDDLFVDEDEGDDDLFVDEDDDDVQAVVVEADGSISTSAPVVDEDGAAPSDGAGDEAGEGSRDSSMVATLQVRVAELLQEVERARAEAEQNKDRLVRKAADLENARRRHTREKEEMTRYAAESLLKDMVPILDDLERALEHLEGRSGDESLLEGVQMVARKFAQTLDRRGVRAVEALGRPFDPQYHEAIQQRPDENVPHNTVVQEFQKGYVLHDRLLRPSLVVVAQGGPVAEESPGPDDASEDGGSAAEEGATGDLADAEGTAHDGPPKGAAGEPSDD